MLANSRAQADFGEGEGDGFQRDDRLDFVVWVGEVLGLHDESRKQKTENGNGVSSHDVQTAHLLLRFLFLFLARGGRVPNQDIQGDVSCLGVATDVFQLDSRGGPAGKGRGGISNIRQ